MKTIFFSFILIVFLQACNNLSINGNNVDSIRLASDDKTEVGKDSVAAIKAWENFRTPNSMHKLLATTNGQWKEAITTWEKPGAAPQKTTATCTNTMIMNGRYQQSLHKGKIMGMPFEGMSTVGFDNARKEFFANWIDNMGTGCMQMNGVYDSTAKIIHFKGTTTNPVSGRQIDIKEDFTFIPDGSQVLELYYIKGDGKSDFKTMEIKFTKN